MASSSGSVWQRPGVSNSSALQPADEETESFPVGFAFYNVGVQNKDVHGKKWNEIIRRLAGDLKKIFNDRHHDIHVLLLTEWGNMLISIDREFRVGATKHLMHVIPYATGGDGQPAVCENSTEFFSTLLESLEMPHIHVYAHPPYRTQTISTGQQEHSQQGRQDRLPAGEEIGS